MWRSPGYRSLCLLDQQRKRGIRRERDRHQATGGRAGPHGQYRWPDAARKPSARVGTADGLYTQLTATGWNVYVGTSQKSMFLQNTTPIALSTTTYTLPNAPVVAGSILKPGQFADYNFAFQNMLLRS
jgi:hypothetical protein